MFFCCSFLYSEEMWRWQYWLLHAVCSTEHKQSWSHLRKNISGAECVWCQDWAYFKYHLSHFLNKHMPSHSFLECLNLYRWEQKHQCAWGWCQAQIFCARSLFTRKLEPETKPHHHTSLQVLCARFPSEINLCSQTGLEIINNWYCNW